MNHWPFIIAAYALTGLGTLGVFVWSYLEMRRAEQAVSKLERSR
ncbi:heme exporter protein CcmD [Chakrabartia godavariana]|nr:heme exporter protein CcmD [Chakrabartia godavariana]